MRLVSIRTERGEEAAIVRKNGVIPVKSLNESAGTVWSESVWLILQNDEQTRLRTWLQQSDVDRLLERITQKWDDVVCAPLYRYPRKIWGIGMNYRQKVEDLASTPPVADPIIFMKPDTSLIGPGDAIILPKQSNHVTAEGEIGIIIGKTCKDIKEDEAHNFIAGITPTLDMTAQDIHAKNPRFLGKSKCFDTFFSFGPELVTLDEIPDFTTLTVETKRNGDVIHQNSVSNSYYSPWFLVSYFSQLMTLLPGDIIMTGTPGSTAIVSGDRAECQISGLLPLVNPVIGLSYPK
ncbi:fumarylacetoacetate hydrolase family protein [Paenibacillus qinlingensis]|nr:fumarylacetoacetate hydrolase family protein [Paenibacillus qinlingensis]